MSLDKITSNKPVSTASSTSAAAPSRQRSLAWLLPVGLLVGFIAILVWLFGDRLLPAIEVETAQVITIRNTDSNTGSKSSARSEKSPPNAEAKTTSKGSMLFQASGWVEPDPYITYVPTLVNGVVSKVHVLEGQSVKKGELLATLIDDDAKLDLTESKQAIASLKAAIHAHCKGTDIAKAELDAAKKKIITAKSQLADAEDHLNRLKRVADGAIAKQKIVQASLQAQQQRAMLEETKTAVPRIEARLGQIDQERIAMEAKVSQLETARDRAQLALDRTKITSPMNGIVLSLHAAPGKKRMLDMDDPKSAVIVELYDPKKLQARVDVPLNEAAALRVGQQVELLSDLLPETVFKGKVTRITGQADLQRNTLQAKIEITNPDPRLRPDMLVRAKFFGIASSTASTAGTSSGRLSIYVPEAAIVSPDTAWVVSPDNRAEKRSIELGKDVRDGHRLVLSGLKSGEHVILPPHDELEDGTRVKPSQKTSN